MGTYGVCRRAVSAGGSCDRLHISAGRRADPLFEVVGYVPSVYQGGFDLFANRLDKAWSLTDCISFHVMSVRGLTEALTADHHFEQAGFRTIFK